jgi:hydroxymethylpyrimidine/phosphomethylpyrimidine kinase
MPVAPIDVPTALTIAGSDSSGGAGIQADLRGFGAVGVHGASVITLVTAQGTRGIRKVSPLAPDLVRAQLEVVLQDLAPRACKTGALGNAAIVEIIADVMRGRPDIPLVVDPVVNPTRGRSLLDDLGFAALVRELIPLATLVIPNKDETTRLAGRTRGLEDARRACKAIVEMGAKHVLVKGGHFSGNDAVDLFFDGKEYLELRSPRLEMPPMHGLGCSLSALITGYLALGQPLRDAVKNAHDTLHRALRQPAKVGDGLSVLSDLSGGAAVAKA